VQGRLQTVSARKVLERAYGKTWIEDAQLDLDAEPLTTSRSRLKTVQNEPKDTIVRPVRSHELFRMQLSGSRATRSAR
jgi:hypothetical protein